MKPSFAIIGCGRIARRHAEQIVKVGELAAVCDTVYENARELADKYSCRLYLTIEELLANEVSVNVVSICTPNGLHAVHSILSLQAGKHVLCEKPMSISSKDAQAMIAASLKADKRLFIVKSARYNPIIIALKKLIDNDGLGNIYSFNMNCVWNRSSRYYKDSWRGTTKLDGGTLYTQFSHYIDILLWLVGDYKHITGLRKNLHHRSSIEFEDSGVVALELQSGAIGTIHYSVNAYEINHEISLNIVSEKGTIHLGGEYLNKIVYQQPALLSHDLMNQVTAANDYGFYKGSTSNHDKVYENVCKALNGEDNNVTDGADALKTVALIEDFYSNIKTP